MEHERIAMRNRYARMKPRDLSRALDDLHLTAGQFARLIGSQRKRVLLWLKGKEDPPHDVRVMTETWRAFPAALELALQVTNAAIIEEEED